MKTERGEEILYKGSHCGYIGVTLSEHSHFPDSLRLVGDNARVTEAMARDIVTKLTGWLDPRKQRETERKRNELNARLETLKAKYRAAADSSVGSIESGECFAAGNGILHTINAKGFTTLEHHAGTVRDWNRLAGFISTLDALEKERREIAAELAALDA